MLCTYLPICIILQQRKTIVSKCSLFTTDCYENGLNKATFAFSVLELQNFEIINFPMNDVVLYNISSQPLKTIQMSSKMGVYFSIYAR